MSQGVYRIQEGLASLGYDPGPIDGLWGPRTANALVELAAANGRPRTQTAQSGLSRIIWHWTAGTHTVSDLDRKHYHFIVAGNGTVVHGAHQPEANIVTSDGSYAAHTRNCNTGSIGVAVAAMAGAKERPFSAGAFPVREAQIEALVGLTADLCRRYSIPVTPRTVLSHAEVQPTLGVAQAGKWDIAWLPGMAAPQDPIAIGNILRGRVLAHMKEG